MNKNTWIGVIVGVIIIIVLGALLLGFNGNSKRNNLYSNIPNTTNPTGDTGGSDNISDPIAYIGCSNTWQIVGGYHSDGGTKFWAADQNYGGGTAAIWGSNLTNANPYWREFDSLNAQDPGAKTLWVMICIKGGDSYSSSYNGAVAAINEAKSRIPTIQNVYATALSEYPDHECGEVKTTGVQNSEQVVSQLISSGLAKAGPVLNPLTRPETTDGCHPNNQARLTLGAQLISFFGK